jgi:hypothetical protein
MEELIAFILFEYVLSFPGALFRRIVYRKKTLREYWRENKERDSTALVLLGFAVLVVIGALRIYIHSHYHRPLQTFVS